MRKTESINLHISADAHQKLKLAAVQKRVPMSHIASPAIEREVTLLDAGQKLLTITIALVTHRDYTDATDDFKFQLRAMVHQGTKSAPIAHYPLTGVLSGQELDAVFARIRKEFDETMVRVQQLFPLPLEEPEEEPWAGAGVQ
jgi:hypothetical protein